MVKDVLIAALILFATIGCSSTLKKKSLILAWEDSITIESGQMSDEELEALSLLTEEDQIVDLAIINLDSE